MSKNTKDTKPVKRTKGPKAARIKPGGPPRKPVDHEGATEAQTGDRTGPGAGYDIEPAQVKDKGGVA